LSSTDEEYEGVYQGLKLSTDITALGTASATIDSVNFTAQDVWCVVQSRQIEQQCSNDAEQPVPIVDSIIRASTEKWQLGVATSTEASWTNKFLLVARNVLEGVSTDANSGVRTTATAGEAADISPSTSALNVDVGLALENSDGISIATSIPVP